MAERQAQFIVGSLILVSVALGIQVSHWYLAITAFLGAGLIVAAVTGVCGLAVLLARAPWNRTAAATVGCRTSISMDGSLPADSCCGGADERVRR